MDDVLAWIVAAVGITFSVVFAAKNYRLQKKLVAIEEAREKDRLSGNKVAELVVRSQ